METADSNKLFSQSNLTTSIFLRFEPVFVFMFFCESSEYIAALLAVVCAMVNLFTERAYLTKETQKQKLALLAKTFLIVLCLFFVGDFVFAHFTHTFKNGEVKIEPYKITLLIKLLAIQGGLIGVIRLIATETDWLIARYRNKKKGLPS